MRGIFWNSKSFGDLAKHSHVSDLVKEHNLFCCHFGDNKQDFSPEARFQSRKGFRQGDPLPPIPYNIMATGEHVGDYY